MIEEAEGSSEVGGGEGVEEVEFGGGEMGRGAERGTVEQRGGMVMPGKISTREQREARGAVRVKESIVKCVRERDHRWGHVFSDFYVLFTGSHLHLDS